MLAVHLWLRRSGADRLDHDILPFGLGLLPKAPGKTEHGYNNWCTYIANFDEDLDDYVPEPSADPGTR